MTSFKDGPAKGQRLMLKRAVTFLRVVELQGKWDALDQLTDEPEDNENVYAYKITGQPGHCHINMGRGRGGFYPIAEYAMCPEQPPDSVMRSRKEWGEWCEAKARSAD